MLRSTRPVDHWLHEYFDKSDTENPREFLWQLCLHHHMPSSPSAVSTGERIASTMDYYSLKVRFTRSPNVSSKKKRQERPPKIYDIGQVACPGKNTSRDPVKVFRWRNHLAEEGDAITGVDSSMLRHPGIYCGRFDQNKKSSESTPWPFRSQELNKSPA